LLVIVVAVGSFAIPTVASDFSWSFSSENEASSKLLLTGEIRPGDYERFRAFMRVNLDRYKKQDRVVLVESEGGDVSEAIKIAGLLKAMYARVWVPKICASACFFSGSTARNFRCLRLNRRTPPFPFASFVFA
jgi:hypothetical protein